LSETEKEASTKSRVVSPLDNLVNASDDKIAGAMAAVVVQYRPALSDIYMAARSAIEIADETGGSVLFDAKGRVQMTAFFGVMQFTTVQQMVGEAHANSVLFFVDQMFREIKSSPVIERTRESGKVIAGYKLTRVLRVATNYLRHRHSWDSDANADESAILAAIGIETNDDRPATKVLKAIGLGTYMDFEDVIANALAELIVGREVDVPRWRRNGGVLSKMLDKPEQKTES
jgi:hypothetical protein